MSSSVVHRFSMFIDYPAFFAVWAAAIPREINVDNVQTQLIVIGLAVIFVVTKAFDAYLAFRKKYAETDHGQLMQCLAERKAEQGVARDALFAEQAAHKNDLDRARTQYEFMIRDYEDRLKHKVEQEEYLKLLVERGREVEGELRAANVSLTATVVQQTEQLARLATLSVTTTQESVKNTASMIKKANRKELMDKAADPNIATLSAPADRIDVVVNPRGESHA